ncbi:MAG: FYDLN acid domain-containing protein [Holosporales bacterium]|jgi:hypothetical protein|nr:FYDLN acid domain-containing protein [Holosporales bacterium]
MVNYAWGKKRVCAGCAVHYYDLRNPVPVCPKCGMALDVSTSDKSKKRVISGISSSDIDAIEDLDFEIGDDSVPDVDIIEEDDFDEDLTVLSTDDEDLL